MIRGITIVFLAFAALMPSVLQAAPSPEHVTGPMQVIDPITLHAEGLDIQLWGIKPASVAETPLELSALDLLDRLTHDQPINCKIVDGTIPDIKGQCRNTAEQDLSMALLEKGLAVIDRRQTSKNPLPTGYAEAQEAARINRLGVWHYFGGNEESDQAKTTEISNKFLLILWIAPFSGLLIISVVVYLGFQRLASIQETAIEKNRQAEVALQSRERRILASTLSTELQDNKNKISAFLTIYGAMLETLKTPGNHSPHYREGGEIIQKHPALSKAVFEASTSKMALLDIKTAGLISRLYASFPGPAKYIDLDPEMAPENVEALLEKFLAEAKGLIPPLEAALAALERVKDEETI